MKDSLTPNLPAGWVAWAEASDTRWLGVGLLVVLNLYLCVRIACSPNYNAREKVFWFVVLWMFPMVSHGLLLHMLWQKRRQPAAPASVDSGTAP